MRTIFRYNKQSPHLLIEIHLFHLSYALEYTLHSIYPIFLSCSLLPFPIISPANTYHTVSNILPRLRSDPLPLTFVKKVLAYPMGSVFSIRFPNSFLPSLSIFHMYRKLHNTTILFLFSIRSFSYFLI